MEILIKGERIELPKNGEFYIDIRIYETGEIVVDGDQDKTAMAIELPLHDDLISRRDAIDVVYGYHVNNHPMKELEELRPVIPASQGKENKPYYSNPSCKYNMWDGN